MVRWVVRSIFHFFCSSQCSTTGVTKAVVCAILSVRDDAYKRTLAVNQKLGPI